MNRTTDEVFWRMIDAARGGAACATLEALHAQLSTASDPELATFQAGMWGWHSILDRRALLAAAATLSCGSDDGFDSFRQWLLLHGKAAVLAALGDPDGLSSWDLDDPQVEGLSSLAIGITHERGSQMAELWFEPDIEREPYDATILRESECIMHTPRLWARHNDPVERIVARIEHYDLDAAELLLDALLDAGVEPRACLLFCRGLVADLRSPSERQPQIDAYRAALLLEPRSPLLHYALARLVMTDPAGNFSAEGVELFRRAIALRDAAPTPLEAIAERLAQVLPVDWAHAEEMAAPD